MYFPGTSSAGGSVDHCIPIWYWMHWNKRYGLVQNGWTWFNNRRLLEPIGDVRPTEYEMMYYRQLEESAMVA